MSYTQPDEQPSFQVYFETTGLLPRLTLICIALLMVGITPFYDRLLLQVPESFVEFSRWMQFGVQMPPMLLALWFTWHPGLRRWSAPATLFAAVVVSLGLCAQHIVGRVHGFHVPHDFSVLALTATLLLGRLRLAYALPWLSATLLVVSSAQLYAYDFSSAALYNTVSLWMLFAVGFVAARLYETSAQENWRQRVQLESQAAQDSLTGLPNRRHFDRAMVLVMRQAAREGKNVALMIMDVDHFKAYNDRYGHPAGDECLRRIGRWMQQCLRRPNDFCARVGGEEFAAVWFDARMDVAPALAEQLRAGIGDLAIEHLSAVNRSVVTCSGGFVQVCAPSTEDAAESAVADLYDQADRALYEAKRAGRDKLVQFGQPLTQQRGTTLWPMI